MTKIYWKYYLLLYLAAVAIRGATFYWTIEPNNRYCQPDSKDYHYAALCMTYGYGMHTPQGKPIFWRTPGYPWYLSFFYDRSQPTGEFSAHKKTHTAAIWFQIFLCALLPLLILQLALAITGNGAIAWICAVISLVHVGFVLASGYLLTDGIALLFFILFLIFLYKSFASRKIYYLLLAAIMLASYTWMRPMGQFVALVSSIIIALFSYGNFRQNLTRASLFLLLFFLLIFPWFWRNYKLTGSWFFCPLFGLYFNVFNAPKILSRIQHIPLPQAHKELTRAAGQLTFQEQKKREHSGDKKAICAELICLQTAWPLIRAHPWYFAWDWFVEICKTAFDPYASQLVAFAGNCFHYDPIIEYLWEKICNCLYKQPMPFHWRLIAWLELVYSLFVWIAMVAGTWSMVIRPIITKNYSHIQSTWFIAVVLIACVIVQTGGFGYARLRLPVEPLMLILGVTYWWHIISKRYKKV